MMIVGTSYRITVSIEWYKNANKGFSTAENEIGTKMLYRIGVERLLHDMRRENSEYGFDEIQTMQSSEMIEQYPNPADRFVKMLRIAKNKTE